MTRFGLIALAALSLAIGLVATPAQADPLPSSPKMSAMADIWKPLKPVPLLAAGALVGMVGMSWSIFVQERKDGEIGLVPVASAREKVAAQQCYEQTNGPEGSPNAQQFTHVQGLVLAELARVPDGYGVWIEASGHADAGAPGASQLRINMNVGKLPTAEPVPG